MKPMLVFLAQGVWHAHKPGDGDWLELFGTDVLPTAFLAATPEADVLAKLRLNNPDFDVLALAE